jgi:hypothetical protein
MSATLFATYRSAMTSPKKLVSGARHYDRLNSRDPGSDLAIQDTADIIGTQSTPSIVRRRRPNHIPKPLSVSIMSFVGLKRLFFQQTLTPVIPSRNTKRDYGIEGASTSPKFLGPFHWNQSSCEPLLGEIDPSNRLLISPGATTAHQVATNESLPADLESQSTNSKNEKANQRKGWRVDARVISDATIGLSDGLTVPFALTAGLSALGNTKVVVYGGFAELIAGAISMGLGGYLGAKSEAYVASSWRYCNRGLTNIVLLIELNEKKPSCLWPQIPRQLYRTLLMFSSPTTFLSKQ